MTNQMLFPPASHRHDPSTSHIAERSVTGSGVRKTHCARVLSAVQRYPRMTAPEYMPWTGLTEIQVRRRLTDLHNAGEIHIAGERVCSVNGTGHSVWEVTT